MSNQPGPTGFQPVQSLPEQRSRPPWLLPLAALLLVGLGGVAVGALLFGGRAAAPAGPTPSAAAPVISSRPSAAPPAGSAAPSAAPSPAASAGTSPGTGPGMTTPPQIATQIEEVVRQVPPLRELEPLREVPYQFVSREEFQAYLAELLEEEVDPVLLATEERLLKRLDLLPDDTDLAALLLELYGAQVAAYYQPLDGNFYIIERDADFAALDRMIVAHEYTHALQDQHFDLRGTRITDPSQGDAALAQLAVVEGDATLLMTYWAQANLSLGELLEVLAESLTPTDAETLEGMPPILNRQLIFPYAEGATFVGTIQREGDWEQVNAMFADPPASTEQILHPEKYQAGDEPVTLELADHAAALGSGWQRIYEQTFGELNAHIWLAGDEVPPETIPGLPVEYPFSEEAAGWGGDRLNMYEGPDDAWAIVWELAWDSTADMQEFTARAQALEPALDGVSMIIESSDDRSWVLVASGQPELDRLRAVAVP